MDAFEAQPLTDDDGNANNLEQEEAAFSIKYLTSSKLMGLEVICSKEFSLFIRLNIFWTSGQVSYDNAIYNFLLCS